MFENNYYKDKLTDMGLTQHTAFGLLLNSLLKPRPEIFLPIYGSFSRLTNSDAIRITIQIRTGDSNMADTNHKVDFALYKNFFSCAEDISDFAKKKHQKDKVL